MKKILLLITVSFILAIISLQVTVSADMGAPEIKPYKAIVSNANGAEYYDMNGVAGKLEYGKNIDVSYEYENFVTKEIYVYFTAENGKQYEMKMADITAIDDENLNNIELDYENVKKMKVLAEEGIEIYKGPSYAYEKTGKIIPKGTELTECLSIKDSSANPWFYVKYGNTSGWICELNGVVGYKKTEGYKIILPRKTSVYKDTEYETVVQIIPANTIITDLLEVDDWSQTLYVTYEGVSGYVAMKDYATNFPWLEDTDTLTYTVNYPAKLYKEGNASSEVLIENIPIGTELEYDFCDDVRFTGWVHTTYNNISGWVFYIEDGSVYEQYLSEAIYPENTDVPVVNTETNKESDVVENVIENETTEENASPKQSVSGTQIVTICIIFAIVIAVTSFVTITLVNRNKNNKESDK